MYGLSASPLLPRTLIFRHAGRGLGKAVKVDGKERGPLQVRLERTASVTGPLLDKEGEPAGGITLQILGLDQRTTPRVHAGFLTALAGDDRPGRPVPDRRHRARPDAEASGHRVQGRARRFRAGGLDAEARRSEGPRRGPAETRRVRGWPWGDEKLHLNGPLAAPGAGPFCCAASCWSSAFRRILGSCHRLKAELQQRLRAARVGCHVNESGMNASPVQRPVLTTSLALAVKTKRWVTGSPRHY